MTVRRILEAEPLRLFMGFLLALVLFAAPAGAQGRTFYVQSGGDDQAAPADVEPDAVEAITGPQQAAPKDDVTTSSAAADATTVSVTGSKLMTDISLADSASLPSAQKGYLDHVAGSALDLTNFGCE